MAEDKKFWVVAKPYNSAIGEGDNAGYFGHRRIKVGQRFQVTEKEFSSRWMERVDSKAERLADEELADRKADKRRKNPGTEVGELVI